MKTQNQEVSFSHTPGPWEYVTKLTASESHRGFFIRAEKQSRNGKWALAEVQPADEDGKTGKANARLIAAAPELLEALQAYQSASAMSVYGDASDFVWPAISMRAEGEPSWGWNCEKHGLGYQRSCICCRDDFARHKERKDREARYSRDEALRNANDLARAAIAKATGAI